MTSSQQKYILKLEAEIGQLKDQLNALGGPLPEPDLEPLCINLVCFDADPIGNDLFNFRVSLPVGGISLNLTRSEFLMVCKGLATVPKKLLEKSGIS